MVIWWLATVLMALLLGAAIGTRRERGVWQRLRRIEAEERQERKSKGGVRLSSIVVRR